MLFVVPQKDNGVVGIRYLASSTTMRPDFQLQFHERGSGMGTYRSEKNEDRSKPLRNRFELSVRMYDISGRNVPNRPPIPEFSFSYPHLSFLCNSHIDNRLRVIDDLSLIYHQCGRSITRPSGRKRGGREGEIREAGR